MTENRNDNNGPLLIIGGALIALGMWFGARELDLIPHALVRAWELVRRADNAIALVLIGVVVILLATRGARINMPTKGTRLYRSRSDKWVSGVLGGLATYFRIDTTLLRLGYLALAFLVDFGTALIAYLVLSVVVPLEPEVSAGFQPPSPPVG
ncbi:MAG: PspC domain-containing protein [Actinomycetota bacterium]|nr:PspC domain-containing protein [Actinomycetota bacterium]MDP3630502.1 PspC domain-containing protein [Actinomycetota bacterium]MDZ4235547.1 PspC domain-containing protein [Dietzia sp.]